MCVCMEKEKHVWEGKVCVLEKEGVCMWGEK